MVTSHDVGVVVNPESPSCQKRDRSASRSQVFAILGNQEIFSIEQIFVYMVDYP